MKWTIGIGRADNALSNRRLDTVAQLAATVISKVCSRLGCESKIQHYSKYSPRK